jgi:hypothetical protein
LGHRNLSYVHPPPSSILPNTPELEFTQPIPAMCYATYATQLTRARYVRKQNESRCCNKPHYPIVIKAAKKNIQAHLDNMSIRFS